MPDNDSFTQHFFWKHGSGYCIPDYVPGTHIRAAYGPESKQMGNWQYALGLNKIRLARIIPKHLKQSAAADLEIRTREDNLRVAAEQHFKNALQILKNYPDSANEVEIWRHLAASQYLREDDINAALSLDHAVQAAANCADSSELADMLVQLSFVAKGCENWKQSEQLEKRVQKIRAYESRHKAQVEQDNWQRLLMLLVALLATRLARRGLIQTAHRKWLLEFYTATNFEASSKSLDKLVTYELARGNYDRAESYSVQSYKLAETYSEH